MEWFTQNLAQSLIVIGLVLLAVEIAILGFSTFILFFVGLAAVFAGVLMFVGVIPETLMSAALAVGLITAMDAALLWKPLKNLQSKVDKQPAQNDLIGHTFMLDEDLNPASNIEYHYSGIQWKLKSSKCIPAGTMVKVVKNAVGIFYVEPEE
ncbi:NfeD family protein [Aliiglaciecola sp. M165]|uniref:NfeD family protein n=1 Tax=Aliiglaciecola sp. M165 TaxID=2593649 RepID=UPI0011801323|nr:NfeD family protein [Aliiglaciecola sp. M165]TRY29050.1 NfeD family protein [Aliiglaciecola sp. M165]